MPTSAKKYAAPTFGAASHRKPRTPPPPSHSGGTSGDLTIPGYTPKTPTVPYDPSAPPTPIQQQIRKEAAGSTSPSATTGNSLADRYLFSRIADLITPGPTARDIAQAASTLGVKPKGLSAPGLVAQTVSHGVQELGKDVAEGVKAATKLPDHRVVGAFGHKTLGKPTVAQLVGAAKKGTLQVNRGGKVTVPATRKAARQLAQARQGVAKSGRIEGITHGPQAERFANTLAHLTGIDPRAIGAWVQAEGGGWGGSGISGGEAGKNNWLGVGYPGEQTPFSQSPYFNSSPEEAAKATAAWMKGHLGGQYNYRAAPSIQRIIPSSKGKGPQAFLQALGQSGWGTNVSSVAQDLGMIQVTPPNPQAVQRLAAAKAQAEKLGIPTRQTGGDLERGTGNVIYVRADAQGMVKWAESALGTQEGSGKQLRWAGALGLGSTEPWCANFVSNGLLRRGFSAAELPANPNNTGTPGYEQWATEGRYATNIGTDLARAKPGDVLAFSGAHTALYVGNGEMISGNFGNEVERTPVSAGPAALSMVIRPHYKGGKVAVSESTPLPGSVIGPGGIAAAPAGAAIQGAAIGGSGGTSAPRPAPAVSTASPVPISSLLDVHTPLPRAFSQFQLGEAPEEEGPASEGTIARILRGRRR